MNEVVFIDKKDINSSFENLFRSILSLENVDECEKFLGDLCTIKELQAMNQRLEVASMLKNKSTYVDISEKTGASTVTIGRVSRCLNYGLGGYDLILEKSEQKSDEQE